MNEDEVQKMITDVEGSQTKIDGSIEKDWLKRELAVHAKNEQEIVMTFRVHKHFRNDEGMKECYRSLVKTRETIKYLQGQLDKLPMSV